LNERGESVSSLENARDREAAEKAPLDWPNSTVEQSEAKLARQQAGLA
jgi:hypothetical protein